jgi:hypothetical protein
MTKTPMSLMAALLLPALLMPTRAAAQAAPQPSDPLDARAATAPRQAGPSAVAAVRA